MDGDMFVVTIGGGIENPSLLEDAAKNTKLFKTSLDAQYAAYAANRREALAEPRVLRRVVDNGTVKYEEVWERGMATYTKNV